MLHLWSLFCRVLINIYVLCEETITKAHALTVLIASYDPHFRDLITSIGPSALAPGNTQPLANPIFAWIPTLCNRLHFVCI